MASLRYAPSGSVMEQIDRFSCSIVSNSGGA